MSIEVRNLSRRFGAFAALDDVSAVFPSGKLVALLGPSGSGKTTLLRIIAGLESADTGTVLFEGKDATARSARDRRVGFVFQHYALFRHMSVFENIAFGLRVKPRRERPPEEKIRSRVHELLGLVQLEGLAGRLPGQLSGGQRQRVALARALAVDPSVLLLDEPFGALDARVREELRRWLRRLHDEIHVTSLFVTHDVEEALEVADVVVVMNHGRIEQVGTPDEVYERPVNAFVCNFLGHVNLFHARVHEGRAQIGTLEVEAPAHAAARDRQAIAYARPHELDIERTRTSESGIESTVVQILPVGPIVRVGLRRSDTGEPFEAELGKESARRLGLTVGERVFARPSNLRIFAEDYVI
ncbi:MAG: sulfate ABC transporter ATP-binding protein [Lentisphaerae bacterium]|nr:sulfate ABC transporter ATP-binding protein [Lentisphaerota bacterium]